MFIQALIEDLEKYVIELQKETFHKLQLEEKEKILNKMESLKLEYRDYIYQILKRFSWKKYEAKILASKSVGEFSKFVILLSKFNSLKIIGSQIKNQAPIG